MAASHSTANNALVVVPPPSYRPDDPGDSLAEAFEACDGDIELLEPDEL